LGGLNRGWHLEFTTSTEVPKHIPDDDDLLVFYASSVDEYNAINEKAIANNILRGQAKNPYWTDNGFTLVDPDGFRIAITKE
jgi:hypothetical protein